ncbi:hypothetical protein AVEN_269481-1 [Araneus ventricosus]|uniref:Uncharacterized protein n=1 Tax=Araneus ventricosus TaxID=182803 RepID=A0A4Y2ACA0_ARAVE|nr:hypothetical protein AVEN_201488-1 [Araneus ventricosus]GBL79391.1 hypothetical protein AVEN_238559-1 [Araneus ventricosus]GBO19685.1 hypothetical protein AVEN_40328-1 [Araneus ventricosus]GBO19701.1 hypothetical protein AVEN_269481-1 [Araneus ventricosus]
MLPDKCTFKTLSPFQSPADLGTSLPYQFRSHCLFANTRISAHAQNSSPSLPPACIGSRRSLPVAGCDAVSRPRPYFTRAALDHKKEITLFPSLLSCSNST